MQINDASCGWNVMSLKRCWVNFILPRRRKKKKGGGGKFDRVQLKQWRFVDGSSFSAVHKPEYTYLLWNLEKWKQSNEMTEILEANWVYYNWLKIH